MYYVGALVGVFVVYYIVSSVSSYWRLRQFRGPWLASWSDLWYIRAAVSGKCHLRLSDVNTKYGPLARIGPNTLLTSDEEFFRKTNSARSGYYKGDFYKAFRFGAKVENVFSEVDNDRHSYLRKRVASGYSGRDNPDLEADVDGVILSLIKSWRDRYLSQGGTNRPMDLAIQIQYLMLDIITCLSFGKPFGWVSSDSDLHEYVSTMAANFPVMFYTSAVPMLSRLLSVTWVQRILGPSVKDRVGMGKIKAVSNEIIAQRFADFKSKGAGELKMDMTTSFISHKLTESEISDGALLAILAGSDTAATVIRTGLIFMLTQPRITRKLQEECDNAHVPWDQIIPHSRALELPYLQACVKESLRLHPVAAGLNPRVVPAGGDYCDGKFIPGGTIIAQCAWNLQPLNYAAYGADADVFRPERWLEAAAAAQAGDRQRQDRMERAHELVFGYGDFKCLGHRLAVMELAKIFFELARRFDIGLLNSLQPMETNWNCGLFVQQGLWVRLEERS